MPLFQDAGAMMGTQQDPAQPPVDPNAQMSLSPDGDPAAGDEPEGGVEDNIELLKTLADHILYDPKGIQMLQEMVDNHMKDGAYGAALVTCSILFQLKDKMQDVSPDAIVGENGVSTHILDSIFEIFHHMKVQTSQKMFNKALGLVAETYNLTNGTADQALSSPPSPGGLFANPMGAPQQ